MKDDGFGVLAGCTGLIVAVVAIVVVNNVVSGLVLQQMWAWFITPVFHITAPSVALSLGLMGVMSMFTMGLKKESDTKGLKTVSAILVWGFTQAVLPALVVLAWGWVVHLFI